LPVSGSLQERRLARAVAADEADPLARPHRELGRFEKGRAAEGERDVLQGEERRSHDA
jgi:hypothetical protein